jgi:hypothetical protein
LRSVVDVALSPAVLVGIGPTHHDPREVEERVTDRPHFPIDDRGHSGRATVVEHDVGELVVAVHYPRLVAPRLVVTKPRRRLVEPGQFTELEGAEMGEPAVHLAIVKTIGPTKSFEPPGLPVNVGQPRDGVDEFVGEWWTGIEIGEERFGPFGFADR